jgi:hypothetical protein
MGTAGVRDLDGQSILINTEEKATCHCPQKGHKCEEYRDEFLSAFLRCRLNIYPSFPGECLYLKLILFGHLTLNF